MSSPETFVWSSRTQTGILLFALSLAGLAIVAPTMVAISCAIGGGAALALFGTSGARFPQVILMLLALVTLGCALFAAVMLRQYHLLPVALGEVAAVALMQPRTVSRDYRDGAIIGPVSAAR